MRERWSAWRCAALGALAALVCLASSARPAAQPAPMRGDGAGMVGWLAERPDLDSDWDDWGHAVLIGVSGGVYWTEHLRTAIDFTWSDDTDLSVARQVPAAGLSWAPLAYSGWDIGHTQIGVGQHYQFFSNTWVHPYVGGGVLIDWERRSSYTPRQAFPIDWRPGSDPGTWVVVAEESRTGPDTRVVARPFFEGGAKVYVSERAFFRAELRWVARDTQQLATRFGVGVDW